MNPTGTVQRGRHEVGQADHRPPAAGFGVRVKAFGFTLVLIVVTLGVGWFAWSVLEWRHGRTASYRLTGLRVVRRSDGTPIGLGRSIVRNGLCCTLLLIPTLVVCVLSAFAFVMGASPPNGLLRQPRNAPWDLLTGTRVLDERSPVRGAPMRLARWHEHVPVSTN